MEIDKELPKNIEHIVINGGGPFILNMYGALKKSNELKMWEQKNIKTYHGTSAGAMLCLILALNFEWSEMDAFIINCPWSNFIKFNVLEIYNYYFRNGINDSGFVYGVFTPLFGAKDIDLNITFAQLHEKLNTDIHVYATSFKTFEIKEFNKDLTPNVKVLEAIYASTALPLMFNPIKIEEDVYIDGGIFLNYPLAKCLEKNVDPQTVLGIKNKYCNENFTTKDDMTMFEYITKLFEMIFSKFQIEPDPNIKIGIEIRINFNSMTIEKFFEMAKSCNLRKIAIDYGIKDVTDYIAELTNSSR